MAIFFNRQAPKDIWVPNGGVRVPARRLWVNRQFAYQDEVPKTLGSGVAVSIKNQFDPADWANPILLKRLTIPAGVEIGASSAELALYLQSYVEGAGNSWAGELVVDNYGTISGLGGAANSGVGGTALLMNFLSRTGAKAIVNNYGTIRAGGGGGGRGGDGARGHWYSGRTVTEGAFYDANHRWGFSSGQETPQTTSIMWAGVVVYSVESPAFWPGPVTVGEWTYYRSTQATGESGGGQTHYTYYVYRQKVVYDVLNITAGGIGGNGGRGQGYDGMNAPGAAGSAGGTNAGAGGNGGWGLGYGKSGDAGGTGGAGSYDGASIGAAGGLAGFYLNGAANVQLNNFGTLQGRIQ